MNAMNGRFLMVCNRSAVIVLTAALAILCGAPAVLPENAGKAPPLKLTLRNRAPSAKDKDSFDVVTRGVVWAPRQTAIIVCDMWDTHHCLNAVLRENELAPRMNEVLEKARGQGVLIIHA